MKLRGEDKKMSQRLLQNIEKFFSKGLSVKTGWGKNEVLVLYKDCVKEACMLEIESMENQIINNSKLRGSL